MTFVQLGKGMTEREITERLVASFTDRMAWPVHFVPPIEMLKPAHGWPLRGVLNA